MEEVKRKEKENILYLLIGIVTLMIATTGATFAYFTATDSNNNVITGNMATIQFNLTVEKVTNIDDELTNEEEDEVTGEPLGVKRGLIPMSNSMVEYAVNNKSQGNQGICVDDNGNVVCQIYKITVSNAGTASMLLDGYVTLENGSGVPTDYPNDENNSYYKDGAVDTSIVKNVTTMRWAQAFCSAEDSEGLVTNCTTVGKTTTTATKSDNGDDDGITTNWTQILNTGTDATAGFNATQILTTGITTKAMIYGSEYDVINKNFIRLSNHDLTTTYDQTRDITSALVYNEFLAANDGNATNDTGTSSSSYVDAQVYYIVVWLSETGTNQTAEATGAAASTVNFFTGTVKFISAQGSEVTATFTDYSSVSPDTV